MATNVFSAPVFFIVFRETLETVIIVSILLAFLRQTLGGRDNDVQTYKKLRLQVWIGVAIGFFICMVIAGALIGVFYTVGSNVWEAHEHYYEGAFCLAASLIITVVGATLLRIGKVQDKWRVKLARALEAPISPKLHSLGGLGRSLAHFCEKYAMFLLPFITVLREGIEAVVFITGVSFQAPASAIPLPVFVGLGVGIFIGWLLYKGGSTAKLQLFLVASTCLLYLVAAGLFSRSVWHFEAQKWNQAVGGDATETGNGPGSYDIDQSVWHVNCCQPDGPDARFWGIFNAVLGWTNSATYGSVISYNLYWLVVIIAFLVMRFRELKGHWPLLQPKTRPSSDSASESVKRVQGLAECKGFLQQAPVPVTA